MALGLKNLSANAGDIRDFNPWVGKIPWRRAWQPTLVVIPGESMDRGAWWATVQRVTKSQKPLKRLSMHTHITLMP